MSLSNRLLLSFVASFICVNGLFGKHFVTSSVTLDGMSRHRPFILSRIDGLLDTPEDSS